MINEDRKKKGTEGTKINNDEQQEEMKTIKKGESERERESKMAEYRPVEQKVRMESVSSNRRDNHSAYHQQLEHSEAFV